MASFSGCFIFTRSLGRALTFSAYQFDGLARSEWHPDAEEAARRRQRDGGKFERCPIFMASRGCYRKTRRGAVHRRVGRLLDSLENDSSGKNDWPLRTNLRRRPHGIQRPPSVAWCPKADRLLPAPDRSLSSRSSNDWSWHFSDVARVICDVRSGTESRRHHLATDCLLLTQSCPLASTHATTAFRPLPVIE